MSEHAELCLAALQERDLWAWSRLSDYLFAAADRLREVEFTVSHDGHTVSITAIDQAGALDFFTEIQVRDKFPLELCQ